MVRHEAWGVRHKWAHNLLLKHATCLKAPSKCVCILFSFVHWFWFPFAIAHHHLLAVLFNALSAHFLAILIPKLMTLTISWATWCSFNYARVWSLQHVFSFTWIVKRRVLFCNATTFLPTNTHWAVSFLTAYFLNNPTSTIYSAALKTSQMDMLTSPYMILATTTATGISLLTQMTQACQVLYVHTLFYLASPASHTLSNTAQTDSLQDHSGHVLLFFSTFITCTPFSPGFRLHTGCKSCNIDCT